MLCCGQIFFHSCLTCIGIFVLFLNKPILKLRYIRVQKCRPICVENIFADKMTARLRLSLFRRYLLSIFFFILSLKSQTIDIFQNQVLHQWYKSITLDAFHLSFSFFHYFWAIITHLSLKRFLLFYISDFSQDFW